MNILLLFDVDGTLTPSTLTISTQMIETLIDLKNRGFILGIVGGGNYQKIISQIGSNNLHIFKYVFSENGIVTYINGVLTHENNLDKVYDSDTLSIIQNKIMGYIDTLELPFRTSDFIIQRKGMWYVTPIGQTCTIEQRHQFAQYDEQTGTRDKIVIGLLDLLSDYDLDVKIGGQIGIGVHPKGWDKSYVLSLFNVKEYDKVLFFGDKCEPNGNDYPLYSHRDIIGVSVKDPLDLLNKLNHLDILYC